MAGWGSRDIDALPARAGCPWYAEETRGGQCQVLQPAHVETAIDVDDFAGAEGEFVGGYRGDGGGDILGLAPAVQGREVLLENQLVVFGFDGAGHVGFDDAGADFKDI